MRPLGRITPTDFSHLEKHPFSLTATAVTVNKTLKLPSWHWTHDQGSEGSCVGHGTAMERAITNTAQNVAQKVTSPTRRYDPINIWNEAKKVDGDPNTNPGDQEGTYVSAAYDVMRALGPVRVSGMKLVDGVPQPVGSQKTPDFAAGATVNRWARTVDELRTSLSLGIPATIGVNWYSGFDSPVKGTDGQYTISSMGTVRGGHCVVLYGASDKRQAFRLKNSWGKDYPLVWIPYIVIGRLLSEYGEATLVVDR